MIRERPPTPPTQIGRTHVTISGKLASPVPRKVVVERLAELPQPVIIERWLPYKQQKRRVLYYSAPQKQSGAVNLTPKNVIVQWRTPGSSVTPRITHLGEFLLHYTVTQNGDILFWGFCSFLITVHNVQCVLKVTDKKMYDNNTRLELCVKIGKFTLIYYFQFT